MPNRIEGRVGHVTARRRVRHLAADQATTRPETIHITGGLPAKTVHVWVSNLRGPGQFEKLADIHPQGGTFTTALKAGYLYTFTTVKRFGKGSAPSPRPRPFPVYHEWSHHKPLDEAPLLVRDRHQEVERREILQLVDRDDLGIRGAARDGLLNEARNRRPDGRRHSDCSAALNVVLGRIAEATFSGSGR